MMRQSPAVGQKPMLRQQMNMASKPPVAQKPVLDDERKKKMAAMMSVLKRR